MEVAVEASRDSRAGYAVKAACVFTEEETEAQPGQPRGRAGQQEDPDGHPGPLRPTLPPASDRTALFPAPPTPSHPVVATLQSDQCQDAQCFSARGHSAPRQRFLMVMTEVATQQGGGRGAARHPVAHRVALTREGLQPNLQSWDGETPRPPPCQRLCFKPPCRAALDEGRGGHGRLGIRSHSLGTPAATRGEDASCWETVCKGKGGGGHRKPTEGAAGGRGDTPRREEASTRQTTASSTPHAVQSQATCQGCCSRPDTQKEPGSSRPHRGQA